MVGARSDLVWFSELRQNSVTRSHGIPLRDNHMSPSAQGGACSAYNGSCIRRSVIQTNKVSGISNASVFMAKFGTTGGPPASVVVSVFSSGCPLTGGLESTCDAVAEQNTFEGPPSGLQNPPGYHMDNCQACTDRP